MYHMNNNPQLGFRLRGVSSAELCAQQGPGDIRAPHLRNAQRQLPRCRRVSEKGDPPITEIRKYTKKYWPTLTLRSYCYYIRTGRQTILH